MQYPTFFDEVETITLTDPLANILGSLVNGLTEFTYIDIVKSAGHSCPTVAGAYLMTSRALKALYTDSIPIRGSIKVEFSESLDEGVAGVIGNVISNITGATYKSGFKGLNGMFARHSLMFFDTNITSSARFTRIETNESVDVFYNPSSVLPLDKMQVLMQKIMSASASSEEKTEFGLLWQDRVRRILLDNADRVITINLPYAL